MVKKFSTILIVLTILSITASCDPPENVKPTEKIEVSLPAFFKGSASIIEYGKDWQCSSTGSVEFMAFENGGCVSSVSFQMVIPDGQGGCQKTGDTKVWVLNGKFTTNKYECYIWNCNDNDSYDVFGKVLFTNKLADTLPQIGCSVKDQGVKISFSYIPRTN